MKFTSIASLLKAIPAPDETARAAALAHWDALAKPLGSLGALEEDIARIAAVTGDPDVCLQRRTLLVLCADNGVVARGVTQTDSSVTAVVAKALAEGNSTVCHMARQANCRVVPVDMGMLPHGPIPGLVDCCVCPGTGDITKGPAMTRAQCEQAVLAGANLAARAAEQGADILATGEMGIGNTTTSAAVACALLGLAPEEAVGRGAGLSDAGLARKLAAVKEALALNQPDPADPLDVLAKVGGLDIAGLCGVFLGAAACRVPVLIDGVISAVAALCAARLCPGARQAMLASHVSAEPCGRRLLEAMGLHPLICAGMRLGEGSGAVAALPLLDLALSVYHGGRTFGALGMEAYAPQEDKL